MLVNFYLVTQHHAECHCQMVITPLYLRNLGFKSQPADQVSWLRVFTIFLSPSRQMLGYYLELEHECSTFFPFHHLLACLPYFEKIKRYLWDHLVIHLPPTITARQQLSKNVPAAIYTHTKREELLEGVFSMWSVSYQIPKGAQVISCSQNFLLIILPFDVTQFAILKHC
jgi:hypothetical protein